MDWLNELFGIKKTSNSEDEAMDVFNKTPEEKLELEAYLRAQQEDIESKKEDERREAEEQAIEAKLVVIDGAKIKMGPHLGEFKVLNDVPTTQDKLTATKVEKQIVNFTFYDGFQILSIDGDWQAIGTYQVQDNEVLLKESTLQITGKMPGNSPPEKGFIEFIDSGQVNVPEEFFFEGAPVPDMEQKINSCSDDFTLNQIKEVWKNATKIEWIKGIVDELNRLYIIEQEAKKLYEIFELNTCLQRAHFFAQAFVESGEDLSGAFNGEGLNYSVEALRSGYPFLVFKNNEKYYDLADSIGRKTIIDPKTKKKILIHKANQEEIANIAYDDANRSKNYKLGNVNPGDGWKFRGRGLMQITGRSNYNSIQDIINERLPDSGIDLSKGMSIFTAKEAVFAGLGDWILKKANSLAEKGATDKIVDSITAKINYSTKSYKERRDAFLRTKEIFK